MSYWVKAYIFMNVGLPETLKNILLKTLLLILFIMKTSCILLLQVSMLILCSVSKMLHISNATILLREDCLMCQKTFAGYSQLTSFWIFSICLRISGMRRAGAVWRRLMDFTTFGTNYAISHQRGDSDTATWKHFLQLKFSPKHTCDQEECRKDIPWVMIANRKLL